MRRIIIPYNPILKERARTMRNNPTPAEQHLWEYLKGKQMLGCDFDRQRPIDQFIVDFYCKDYYLAIELDGSVHDFEEAKDYDERRTNRLNELGVTVLRFSNTEAIENTNTVIAAIAAWLLAEINKTEI